MADLTIDPLKDGEYTKFEKARLIGARALQISMGAPFMVKLNQKQLEEMKFNPVEIAKLEFEEGVLPIDIRRKLPGEQ
jgi:DNA-directed RNA polymerase subunit K/omega